MGQHGGKRPNSGRKSKAEELGLQELMDSIGPTKNVLKEIFKLAEGIPGNEEKGIEPVKPNIEAQKLWLSYYYGKPKETVNVKSDNTIHWIEQEDNGDNNS